MCTPEIVMAGPGTLALNCRPMHSSGWMLITRKFWASWSTGVLRNIANGACLNSIATSVRRHVLRLAIVLDFVVADAGRDILRAHAVGQRPAVTRNVDRIERVRLLR